MLTGMEDKDFYYIKYRGQGVDGAIVLPQSRLEPGVENPDGVNLAEAHRILAKMFNRVVVVEFWQKITPRRRAEFEAFVQEVMGQAQSGRPLHLHLVPPPVDLGPDLGPDR